MMVWTVKDVIEALQRDCEPDELIAWSAATQDDASRRFPHLNEAQIEAVMKLTIQYADDNEPVFSLLDDAHYELIGRPPE